MTSPSVAWRAGLLCILLTPGLCRGSENPIAAGASNPAAARTEQSALEPGHAGKARPESLPGSSPAGAVAPPDAGPKVLVKSIAFEGNRVIPTSDLAPLARPMVGTRVTLEQLKDLARRVTELYHARGYLVARCLVPAQEIQTGDVRLTVFEGQIGTVTVEGNRHYSSRFIERFFSLATREGVLREAALQRRLLVLDDFPDLNVQAILERGKAPGTVDVNLRVKDARPLHVDLDYNNFGPLVVGQNRAGIALSGGNALSEGDLLYFKTTFQWTTTSDPLYQASYSIPVLHRGDRVGFLYQNAATAISGDLALLDFRGNADIFGLTYDRPLERSLSRTSNFDASLISKTVRNFVFGNVLRSQDDLRELTGGYTSSVSDAEGRTLFTGVVTQGLGTALGGEPRGNALSSRAGASDTFTKVNLDAVRLEQLARDDLVLLRFSGQVSSEPLAVAEQFAIGGPDSVRGFVQSEFLGDQGFGLSAEFRHALVSRKDLQLQAGPFIDYAHAMLEQPGAGEIRSANRTGAGVGMRAGFGQTTALRLDLGWPISPGDNVQHDRPLLYASAATRF